MITLHFDGGGQVITITIKGKNVFFSNYSLGLKNVPIEKMFTRSNALSIIKSYPELAYLPHDEVISIGIEKWMKRIDDAYNDLGEQGIKKYVIDDMHSHGLIYIGGNDE